MAAAGSSVLLPDATEDGSAAGPGAKSTKLPVGMVIFFADRQTDKTQST